MFNSDDNITETIFAKSNCFIKERERCFFLTYGHRKQVKNVKLSDIMIIKVFMIEQK